MSSSGNDAFQQQLAHVMALLSRGAMFDPFYAISDRDHLVTDHMALMKRTASYEGMIKSTTALNFKAPNRAYPIISIWDKTNMINIGDILGIGPDHVHKDKFLLCRAIVPPAKINAVHSLIEDPTDEKRVLRVEIHNCLDDIAIGSILVIMHPWFKNTADGLASIKVQNPSHVEILIGNESILRGIVWATPDPSENKAKAPLSVKSNLANRDDPAYEGNGFLVCNEYTKALQSYSSSIDKHPDVVKLYSNRALTYLKLERPFHALKDLDVALKLDPDDAKLIYRKCKALLALRRFFEARQFLDESIGRLEQLTKNKEFKAMLDDMDRQKPEYERGQYDLPSMIEESKISKLLDNHADHIARSKFEIRVVAGKGRGLVAKEKIDAGELLIGCKAFVFAEAESEGVLSMDPIDRRMDVLSFVPMVEKTYKKLMDRPDMAQEFYRLYAGPKLGHLEKWTEGESSLIDVDRIESVIRTNHIGTDASLDGSFTNVMGGNDGGLWLIPSYINHTCVDTNCTRYFVGDYIFVRATKSIEKGEEILFPYICASESFEKRQLVCRGSFGFDCQCRLCVLDRQDTIEIKQGLDKICKFVDDLGERTKASGHIPCDIPTLKKLLRDLLQLRPQRDLNYVALRVQEALAALTSEVSNNESLRLMTGIFEILKSNGDFPEALKVLKFVYRASWIKGEGEQEKWKMEAHRIAKLIYGDERMVEL